MNARDIQKKLEERFGAVVAPVEEGEDSRPGLVTEYAQALENRWGGNCIHKCEYEHTTVRRLFKG